MSNKKKKRNNYRKKHNLIKEKFFSAIITTLILYLIPIVDLVFLIVFLTYNSTIDNIVTTLLQFTSLIASTSVSVAASILFYKNFDKIDQIISYRIIIIVFSLSIHIIVETLLIRTDVVLTAKIIFLIVLFAFSVFLAFLVVKYYRAIDTHRKTIEKNFESNPDYADLEKAIKEKDAVVGDKKYNIGGEEQ